MMTTSATKIDAPVCPRCHYFGVAVRGPAHRRTRTACEDAWRGASLADGRAIVSVADGMGSRKEAARGASKATSAMLKAFRNWSRRPGVEAEWMLRWLECQWRMEIAPSLPGNCATTCLFAGWVPRIGLWAGGLGDGMILLHEHGKPVRRLLGRNEESALNETKALGCDHRLSDWITVRLLPRRPWAAILMTDGVADDLRPERLNEFCDWLVTDVAMRKPTARRRMLQDVLVNWPTPGNFDDKAIAVLFSP